MIDNKVKLANPCRGIYLPPATIERADTLDRAAGLSRSRLVRILIESAASVTAPAVVLTEKSA